MATAPATAADPALDAHVAWYKFRNQIVIFLVLVVVAIAVYGAYRVYSDRRAGTAAAALATAKTAPEFEQVIKDYSGSPAAASAMLFLADAQRGQKKFDEANATLETFLKENPKHELAPSAELSIAGNFDAMGKPDEAINRYKQLARNYPQSYAAPLALMAEVPLLKAKNQIDEARQVFESVINQYQGTIWAMQAMQELRTMKPSPRAPGAGPSQSTVPGMGGPNMQLQVPAAPPSGIALPPPAANPNSANPAPAATAKP